MITYSYLFNRGEDNFKINLLFFTSIILVYHFICVYSHLWKLAIDKLLKHCFHNSIKFRLSNNRLILWNSDTKRLKGLRLELVANEVAFEPSRRGQKGTNRKLLFGCKAFHLSLTLDPKIFFGLVLVKQALLPCMSHQGLTRCKNLSVVYSPSQKKLTFIVRVLLC